MAKKKMKSTIKAPQADSVSAKLTEGEYVLSREDVAKLGGIAAVDQMVAQLRSKPAMPMSGGAMQMANGGGVAAIGTIPRNAKGEKKYATGGGVLSDEERSQNYQRALRKNAAITEDAAVQIRDASNPLALETARRMAVSKGLVEPMDNYSSPAVAPVGSVAPAVAPPAGVPPPASGIKVNPDGTYTNEASKPVAGVYGSGALEGRPAYIAYDSGIPTSDMTKNAGVGSAIDMSSVEARFGSGPSKVLSDSYNTDVARAEDSARMGEIQSAIRPQTDMLKTLSGGMEQARQLAGTPLDPDGAKYRNAQKMFGEVSNSLSGIMKGTGATDVAVEGLRVAGQKDIKGMEVGTSVKNNELDNAMKKYGVQTEAELRKMALATGDKELLGKLALWKIQGDHAAAQSASLAPWEKEHESKLAIAQASHKDSQTKNVGEALKVVGEMMKDPTWRNDPKNKATADEYNAIIKRHLQPLDSFKS